MIELLVYLKQYNNETGWGKHWELIKNICERTISKTEPHNENQFLPIIAQCQQIIEDCNKLDNDIEKLIKILEEYI